MTAKVVNGLALNSIMGLLSLYVQYKNIILDQVKKTILPVPNIKLEVKRFHCNINIMEQPPSQYMLHSYVGVFKDPIQAHNV